MTLVSSAENSNLARSRSIRVAKTDTPAGSSSPWGPLCASAALEPCPNGLKPPGKFSLSSTRGDESTEGLRVWRRVAPSRGVSSLWMKVSATETTESARFEPSRTNGEVGDTDCSGVI